MKKGTYDITLFSEVEPCGVFRRTVSGYRFTIGTLEFGVRKNEIRDTWEATELYSGCLVDGSTSSPTRRQTVLAAQASAEIYAANYARISKHCVGVANLPDESSEQRFSRDQWDAAMQLVREIPDTNSPEAIDNPAE